MVIEVFPTGGMPCHYQPRVDGKLQRVTLGRYPALSLRQGARPKIPVAEFGERFLCDIVHRDRKDTTIPRHYFKKPSCRPSAANRWTT